MIVEGTHISMTRGDSESITVTLKNSTFQDGDKIEFTVRKFPGRSNKNIYKCVTDFSGDKAVIKILPEDTTHMLFSDYVYDIQLTGADGTVITIIKPSKFTILPEVSYG